jgi:hypothetical protein
LSKLFCQVFSGDKPQGRGCRWRWVIFVRGPWFFCVCGAGFFGWHPRGAYAAQAVFRWHPRYAFVLQALPLCGAALTFFAAAKKVSKESGLTPPVLVIV